jgi:hypothetical protein
MESDLGDSNLARLQDSGEVWSGSQMKEFDQDERQIALVRLLLLARQYQVGL